MLRIANPTEQNCQMTANGHVTMINWRRLMDRESIQPGGRQQSTKTGIRSWTWLCLS